MCSAIPYQKLYLPPFLSNSFNFPRYTTFDPVIIIFSFNMSKPSQPTLFDHQTNWFQSWVLCVLHFFLSFSLTPHIHLIILISVRFIFDSCSTFIGQVSLPCISQLLTQVAYTLSFSINENPFPIRMGRYSRNVFQADLTGCYCWITSSICIQRIS